MSLIIDFEGLHGAGKTTQVNMLESRLKGQNRNVYRIQSNDKPFSRFAMDYLKDNGPQSPETLYYLSMANNFTFQKELKKKDRICLLDRYIYTDIASTLIAKKSLEWMYNCAKPFIFPDLAIFLDVSPKTALERKQEEISKLERGGFQEGFDDNDFLSYQERLQNAYQEIASRDKRLVIIDGEGEREKVHHDIYINVDNLLR